ncbi:hypothetical protein M080_7778 [Bacteroides fragilis str. 3397 T10]|nr:hypothetical protein M080_7778 [Bacteroides fragilis str. 3397 T10]
MAINLRIERLTDRHTRTKKICQRDFIAGKCWRNIRRLAEENDGLADLILLFLMFHAIFTFEKIKLQTYGY